MSKMKNILPALLGMAMMFDGGQSRTLMKEKIDLTPDDLKQKKEDQMKAAGLKLFIIQGQEIWALNEKNALKKYNKITHSSKGR